MLLTPPKHPMVRNLHLESVRERTPLRKSVLNSSFSSNQSQIALESDESERNKRRSLADIQRRLSTVVSSPVIKVGDQEIKTHFQICLKMFAENGSTGRLIKLRFERAEALTPSKFEIIVDLYYLALKQKISSKNAWNLKIIDYMRQMLQTNKMGKDSLQLGSASLDVSAKVYGIRVDDIHSDGLKLASSMARIAHNAPAIANNVDSTDGPDEQVENQNPAAKRKKKQRRLSASTKHTIAKDPSSLLADIPKLETAFFQTRSNADASTMDNYFTNRLLKDPTGCKFMLLSNKRVWDDDQDQTLEGDEKYSFTIEKLTKLEICPDFRSFEIDVWDPDNDDVAENSTIHENSELVFDDKGIPMAELDGSIHCDVFDAPDPFESDVEEDVAPQIISKQISRISELKPTNDNCSTSEYLYHSLLKFTNKSSQLWAGPSHWKLKHLQRAESKFSGAVTDIKPKAAQRKKNVTTPNDYRMECESIQENDEGRQLPPLKKIPMSHPTDKYCLPVKHVLPSNFFQKLLMKHVYMEAYKNQDASEHRSSDNDEYEIGPYNYENANDSMYCSQNNLDEDGGHHTDEEEELVMNMQNPQYMGENLIEQVDIVPKTKVGYATQAKKMDMKKLKAAIWKCLVNEHGDVTDETYKKKVRTATFAEVYNKLPSMISKKMAEELSCSLAFIAILHLTNENNLMLTGQGDLSNFLIEQGV